MSAAKLCQRLNLEVFVSESKAVQHYEQQHQELMRLGIPNEFGSHGSSVFDCDTIITSPGIPPQSAVIQEAERLGIPIISELEFAYRSCRNPIIAITGTNGKTTTTALTAYILNQSGHNAVACGNIGLPLSDLVLDAPSDQIFVAECSSYQLDRTVQFRPQVAAILNISPDHLAYHGTVDNYVKAKWKISSNQGASDTLILCADDPLAASGSSTVKSHVLWISAQHPVQPGMYVRAEDIVLVSEHKEEILMQRGELRLPGVHNVYNSMAAALAARAFEIRNEDLRDSLMSFSGVEHRLESVRVVYGVEYVNDSKATNVNATWYALQSYTKPIILIAGGRGDNNDYSLLDDVVRKNVKCIIAIGEEQEALFQHFCTIIRCIKSSSLDDAVHQAQQQAMGDDVVLFSPACKSFDMFMNFEHRGQVFKEIVQSL